MTDNRLIIVPFPLKRISLDFAQENNIRHRNISPFQNWPARRSFSLAKVNPTTSEKPTLRPLS